MCDLNKPLFQCTLGDFIEAFKGTSFESIPVHQSRPMVKGLAGIQEIFNCSEYRAIQIKKSHVIDKAITYLGSRTFVVNPELALQLWNSQS